MKYIFRVLLTFSFLLPATASAQEEMSLETYLAGFDYEERAAMKVESKGLIPLLVSG